MVLYTAMKPRREKKSLARKCVHFLRSRYNHMVFFAVLSRLVRISGAGDNKGFNERYPAFVLRFAGLPERKKTARLPLPIWSPPQFPGVINDHAESSAISIIAPLGFWSRLAAVALLRQGGGRKGGTV